MPELTIQSRLSWLNADLRRAQDLIQTSGDAVTLADGVSALVDVCGQFAGVIREQQRQIEHLEDVLQDHVERRK